jgi:hypothetical protein
VDCCVGHNTGGAGAASTITEGFMRIFPLTAIAVWLFGAAAWAGEPVGTYDVSGSNPGGGSSYTGTAKVEKTGDTYRVTWEVAGTRFVGTGLGDSRFLGVSYHTGNNTGLALYAPAGSDWEGVWTYADGTQLGKEKWTRR